MCQFHVYEHHCFLQTEITGWDFLIEKVIFEFYK